MLFKNIRHRLKLIRNNVVFALRHDVLLEKAVTIKYLESIAVGKKCTIQSGTYLYGSRSGKQVVIGDFVTVGSGSTLLGEGGITLGDYTHVSPHCVLTTMYGDSTSSKLEEKPAGKTAAIMIGRGCWIGSGSVIMPGTVLGDCSVVAPNSVVYGRWKANTKLMGAPAREVGI